MQCLLLLLLCCRDHAGRRMERRLRARVRLAADLSGRCRFLIGQQGVALQHL